MIRATLSIMGLYNIRPDIFDNMQVPDGVNMEVLTPELLAELAELELLYSDPDVMKMLIGVWSARRLYAWEKLYATTKFDYNPIWNKDGTVTETETRDLTGKDTETRDLSSVSTSTAHTDTHDHGDTYGYNSSNKSPVDDRTGETDSTGTGSGTDRGTVDNDRAENETITRSRIEQGNIGIVTTQAMIREERDIADFDIYDYIINDFKNRFCLLVY